MSLRTLTADERKLYVKKLGRFTNSAVRALRLTGSETRSSLNPSDREVYRAFSRMLGRVAAAYQLWSWQDKGELDSRYGTRSPLVVRTDTGLPVVAGNGDSFDAPVELAGLTLQAIDNLQRKRIGGDADRVLAMDALVEAAMEHQHGQLLAAQEPIPCESGDNRQYSVRDVMEGERRTLQDLTAVRYSPASGCYILHYLRAWRSPDAEAPIFVSDYDGVGVCSWYTDRHNEAIFYSKLIVGPFVSELSGAVCDNEAIADVRNRVSDPEILRLQQFSDDRDGIVGETECWIVDEKTYSAASDVVGSIFRVYEI